MGEGDGNVERAGRVTDVFAYLAAVALAVVAAWFDLAGWSR